MPRGGRRPNQTGRPKGAKTNRTREIAVQAALTGQKPLKVMLEAMRFYQALHGDMNAKANVRGAIDKAAAIAKDAAPYMHPRLANVEHASKDTGANDRSFTITIGHARLGGMYQNASTMIVNGRQRRQ